MKKLLLLLIIPLLSFGQVDSISVLFLGNSYTSANNLPNIVFNIANSMGDYLQVESSVIGGATLQDHTSNINSNELIMQGVWDYVVLQEQSQYPSFPLWQVEQDVFPYASQLNQLIIDNNMCGRTVFFMTWGRENGDAGNCPNWPPVCTYEGMDDLLQERYLMMANENEALVSPVGAVWRYIREFNKYGQYEIDLYSPDGSHPSVMGSYVAAICFYTTLFQKDPTEIPWNGNEEWNISESDAEFVKEVVKYIVYDNFEDWNIVSNDIDDDGICDELEISGCTDSTACNYNSDATEDNSSCIYQGGECIVAVGLNGEILYGIWNEDCSECIYDNTFMPELSNSKKIIRVIDVLGKDTNQKGFNIEIYDDGSVEKKYVIE